jgi:hypothetical protein
MNNRPTDHLDQAVTALDGLTDPAERAVEGHRLQEALKGTSGRVRAITDAAVAELRRTMPLADVAGLLGVSVQRASQMATSKHSGKKRPAPSVIYAVRIAGEETWLGQPEALPEGDYQTVLWHPKTGRGNRFDDADLEVRIGPVEDDLLPSFYTFTTLAGRRVRPTRAVHELVFGTDAE